MPDTLTPNLALTKISRRKGWAEEINENFEKLGVLHYIHTDGSMHICKNAVYSGGTWVQPDTSLRSSLIVMSSDGSFIMYTCAAGSASISWITVATFNASGLLTLPGGISISAGGASINGALSVIGNISATGSISGTIAALLSLLSINADKNWNAKAITNLKSLQTSCLVSSSGSTVLKSGSGGSVSQTTTLVDLASVYVPLTYSLKAENTFLVDASFSLSNTSDVGYIKIFVGDTQIAAYSFQASSYTMPTVTLSKIRAGDLIRIRGNVNDGVATMTLTAYSLKGSISQTTETIGGNTNPTW